MSLFLFLFRERNIIEYFKCWNVVFMKVGTLFDGSTGLDWKWKGKKLQLVPLGVSFRSGGKWENEDCEVVCGWIWVL